jgi:hypothetical protein
MLETIQQPQITRATQTLQTQGIHSAASAPVERPRAIFCPEDFELIRNAISHYLQQEPNHPNRAKYSNLYHRLGRLA